MWIYQGANPRGKNCKIYYMTSQDDKSLATINPEMDIASYKNNLNEMMKLVKRGMHDGVDYGIIPGTKKKSLYDPGAEKLARYFGLIPSYVLVKEIEDFEKGFFYYKYSCTLTHFKSDRVAGHAERSCNSFENKYLFKTNWVNNQKVRARKSIEELIEGINTYQAMAQKRAFVEAVKTATMASEIFFADGEEEQVAPNKPATKAEDPARIRLLGRLFSTASDRGFDAEQVKTSLKKKYNVESITNISNADIMTAIETLTQKFPVKAEEGSVMPPAASRPKAEEVKKNPSSEGDSVQTGTGSDSPESLELISDFPDDEATVSEKYKCYKCGKETPEGEWFCPGTNHKEEYWKEKDPTMYKKMLATGVFKKKI